MLISLSFCVFFIAVLDFNKDFLYLLLELDSDTQHITSFSKPMIQDCWALFWDCIRSDTNLTSLTALLYRRLPQKPPFRFMQINCNTGASLTGGGPPPCSESYFSHSVITQPFMEGSEPQPWIQALPSLGWAWIQTKICSWDPSVVTTQYWTSLQWCKLAQFHWLQRKHASFQEQTVWIILPLWRRK